MSIFCKAISPRIMSMGSSAFNRGHGHHRALRCCNTREGRPRRFGGFHRGGGTGNGQQFLDGPAVISDPSGHGGGPLEQCRASPPQPGPDHQGQHHPYDTLLSLDPDLVGLPLSEVPRLLDPRRLHGLALPAGTCPPPESPMAAPGASCKRQREVLRRQAMAAGPLQDGGAMHYSYPFKLS
jgi:hypothetical protein